MELAHRSLGSMEQKLTVQHSRTLGSISTPAHFDLDEHRAGTVVRLHCMIQAEDPRLAAILSDGNGIVPFVTGFAASNILVSSRCQRL